MIWLLIVINIHGGIWHYPYVTEASCQAAAHAISQSVDAQAMCVQR